MSSSADLRAGSQEKEFLGHPMGLSILFLTEMWERFSYYGMRAILILFLTKHFLFSAQEASLIYGAYIGLVYMLPVLGGYLADRYLGSRKAVTYGALLLVVGHISLAFEGPPAMLQDGEIIRSEDYLSIFYLSLALVITGVGFLKANISTIVGSLYGENDPRRDGGFTIFYMGINVGSVTSIGLVGYIGETYGWSYGFGLAGIGMLLGLMIFLWGQKFLDGRADPPNPAELKEKVFAFLNREHLIYLLGLGLVILSWVLMQNQKLVGQALGASGLVMLAIIIVYGFRQCTPVERDRLLVASFLISVQAVFWALFEQQGASLTLLADQQFDLSIFWGAFTFKASMVQLLNPLFIVFFAPVFAWMWVALNRKGLEPSTPAKFAFGLIILGLGYVVFAFGLTITDGSSRNIMWLVFIYFCVTAGELCVSPVGLSMVTKLSVTRLVGMMMGTWFLFTSMGNFLAGWISSLTGGDGHGVGGSMLDVSRTAELFQMIGAISIGLGVFMLLFTPLMRRRMHGVH